MPQIIVNSTELRRFARFLEEIAEEIRAHKSVTTQRLDHLKQTWRDSQLREFVGVYDDASREIDQFIKAAFSYARYLEQKAARIDRYLS